MDKEPQSWLVVVVKVKPGKERQMIKIDNDGKSDGCEVNERNNARQPNRDKFQELDATGSGKEEKTDSSSYGTLQIYGPSRKWKVHWGTRENAAADLIRNKSVRPPNNLLLIDFFYASDHAAAPIDEHTGALVALFNSNIQTRASILPLSGNASAHDNQRQLSSLHINLPRASSTIWRLRWAPHTHCSIPIVNSPKLFFPTTNILLLEQAPYNARSTLVTL
jgi:hypothetical protein